jgi:hypothetical protein
MGESGLLVNDVKEAAKARVNVNQRLARLKLPLKAKEGRQLLQKRVDVVPYLVKKHACKIWGGVKDILAVGVIIDVSPYNVI